MSNNRKYPCGLTQKFPNFCKGKKCADCNLNDQKQNPAAQTKRVKREAKITLTERHVRALQDAIDAMSNYACLDEEQNKSIDLIADIIAKAQKQLTQENS